MKNLFFLFLILTSSVFAQNSKDTYQIYYGCYTNGDTIPDESIMNLREVTVYKNNQKPKDASLGAWDYLIYKNKKITTLPGTGIAPWVYNKDFYGRNNILPDKIVIQNILINIYDGDKIIASQKLSPQTFYRKSSTTKKCDQFSTANFSVKGKILTGAKTKTPLSNQKVKLVNEKHEEVQSATTDQYGDFEFVEVQSAQKYNLEIDKNDKVVDGLVFLAKQDGTIVRGFNRSGETYVFSLLPQDVITLKEEKAEDTELSIQYFSTSKQSELTAVENIYYEANVSTIKPESFPTLDKIIAAMVKDKTLYLSINSFTDSKGDEEANLILSKQRAQKVMAYFVSKGIEQKRLEAKGFGESQIKNRCINGVDCSEKEQQLNRRTEFKFTKAPIK